MTPLSLAPTVPLYFLPTLRPLLSEAEHSALARAEPSSRLLPLGYPNSNSYQFATAKQEVTHFDFIHNYF